MTTPTLPTLTVEEKRARLTLQLVPGLGPRLTAALLEHFGSAVAVCQATSEQMQRVARIGAEKAQQFVKALREIDLKPEIEAIKQHGAQVLVLGTAGYPPALAAIPNPPPLLYVRGQLLPAD